MKLWDLKTSFSAVSQSYWKRNNGEKILQNSILRRWKTLILDEICWSSSLWESKEKANHHPGRLLLRLVETWQVGILHCCGDLGPQVFLASFSSPQGGEKVLEIIMSRCSPHESLKWNFKTEDKTNFLFTFLAWRIMPVKSSYSAGVRW